MDETRALLDALMGPNRDKKEVADASAPDFVERTICKNFLVGFCPHDWFSMPKRALAPCNKIHSELMKERFEQHPEVDKYRAWYEEDFLTYLQPVARDCDAYIVRERIKCRPKSAGMKAVRMPPDVKERYDDMEQRYGELVKSSEEAADESLSLSKELMGQAMVLKEELDAVKAKYTTEFQGEDICEVCGVKYPLGGGGAEWHDKESHKKGKTHQGFATIRETIDNLLTKRKEWEKFREKRKKEHEPRMQRERETEKPAVQREADRPRQNDRDRDRERARDKDRDRARDREDRERSRGREKPKSKEADKDRDRDRKADRGRDKSRSRGKDADKGRDRGGKARKTDRSSERSRSRRHRDRDRSGERSRSRRKKSDREPSAKRSRSRSGDKEKAKGGRSDSEEASRGKAAAKDRGGRESPSVVRAPADRRPAERPEEAKKPEESSDEESQPEDEKDGITVLEEDLPEFWDRIQKLKADVRNEAVAVLSTGTKERLETWLMARVRKKGAA